MLVNYDVMMMMIIERIQYKLAVLTYKVLHGGTPSVTSECKDVFTSSIIVFTVVVRSNGTNAS